MALQLGNPCPICLQNGRTGNLTQQQINFEEALLLCDNAVCVFPLGYHDVQEYSVSSHIDDLPVLPAEPSLTPGVNDPFKFIQEVLQQPGNEANKTAATEMEVVKKNVFLQWRNNNALCWLDVLLNLLVHCSWLRRLVDTREPSIPSTITMLMATYDHALFMMTKHKSGKELKQVVAPSGGGSCGEPLQQPTAGNPILRRFFDSLDVYGLSGKEKRTDVVSMPSHSVLNYDSHELPDISKTIASKPVHIEDKPEALVKLRRHLRQAASQYKNVDVRVYHDAEKLLNCAREEVWEKLHPLMQCEKGKNDSPLIALFVLLHTWTTESAHVGKLFNISGRWEMTCTTCKQSSNLTISDKAIVTFPLVKEDFSANNAYFIRTCPSCSSPNQEFRLHIDQMPECLMFHFMNGLPSCDLEKYSFERNGDQYRVRALVRYKNKPTDHFIAYVRDSDNRMWMECDDLKSPLCTFSMRKLQIPPNEIHLVMWEKNHSTKQVATFGDTSSSLGNQDPVNVNGAIASRGREVIMDIDAELSAILSPDVPEPVPRKTGLHAPVGPHSCSSSQENLPDSRTPSDENRPNSRASSREYKPTSRTHSQESVSRASSREGKSRGSSQEDKSRSRSSSRRPSRAPSPSLDGRSSENSSGKRSAIPAVPKITTEKSVADKLKDLRYSVFKERTVDYVWDKLTSDNKAVSGKDAAIKAYAQHQQGKSTGVTPKLKSRLSSYLSSLKPQKSAGKDFQSYTPGTTQNSNAEPSKSTGKSVDLMASKEMRNRSVPGPAGDAGPKLTHPVSSDSKQASEQPHQLPVTAPLEVETSYDIGGRAGSVDDALSVISTSSFSSLPSSTSNDTTMSSITSMRTLCSNTSSTSTKSSEFEWLKCLPKYRKRKYASLYSSDLVGQPYQGLVDSLLAECNSRKKTKRRFTRPPRLVQKDPNLSQTATESEIESESDPITSIYDFVKDGAFSESIMAQATVNPSKTTVVRSDIVSKNTMDTVTTGDTTTMTTGNPPTTGIGEGRKTIYSGECVNSNRECMEISTAVCRNASNEDYTQTVEREVEQKDVDEPDIQGLMSILDCSVETIGSEFLSTDMDDILEGSLGAAEVVDEVSNSEAYFSKSTRGRHRPASSGKNLRRLAEDKRRTDESKLAQTTTISSIPDSHKPIRPKGRRTPSKRQRTTKQAGLQDGDEIVLTESGEYMVLRKMDPELVKQLKLPAASASIDSSQLGRPAGDGAAENHFNSVDTATFLQNLAQNIDVQIEYPHQQADKVNGTVQSDRCNTVADADPLLFDEPLVSFDDSGPTPGDSAGVQQFNDSASVHGGQGSGHGQVPEPGAGLLITEPVHNETMDSNFGFSQRDCGPVPWLRDSEKCFLPDGPALTESHRRILGNSSKTTPIPILHSGSNVKPLTIQKPRLLHSKIEAKPPTIQKPRVLHSKCDLKPPTIQKPRVRASRTFDVSQSNLPSQSPPPPPSPVPNKMASVLQRIVNVSHAKAAAGQCAKRSTAHHEKVVGRPAANVGNDPGPFVP